MNAEELLDQLPALQQLLYRLVCCQVITDNCPCNDSLIRLSFFFFFFPFLYGVVICLTFCSLKDLPATTISYNMPWPWYETQNREKKRQNSCFITYYMYSCNIYTRWFW